MQQPNEGGGLPTPPPQGVEMVDPQPLTFRTTVTGAQFPVMEPQENGQPKMTLKEHVVVFHSTPAGMAVMVWDLPAAEKIAKDVYAACHRMKTSLIVPDGTSARDIAEQALEKHIQSLKDKPDA